MTDLLERAIEVVRRLPSALQVDAAQMLLRYAETDAPYVLSEAEAAALDRSEVAAARGEFATDSEIDAIWPATAAERRHYAAGGCGPRRGFDVDRGAIAGRSAQGSSACPSGHRPCPEASGSRPNHVARRNPRDPRHPYPYLVFHSFDADRITIHAVRHSARDPNSMP